MKIPKTHLESKRSSKLSLFSKASFVRNVAAVTFQYRQGYENCNALNINFLFNAFSCILQRNSVTTNVFMYSKTLATFSRQFFFLSFLSSIAFERNMNIRISCASFIVECYTETHRSVLAYFNVILFYSIHSQIYICYTMCNNEFTLPINPCTYCCCITIYT